MRKDSVGIRGDTREAAVLGRSHPANRQTQKVKAQDETPWQRVHRYRCGAENVPGGVHVGKRQDVVGGVEGVGDNLSVMGQPKLSDPLLEVAALKTLREQREPCASGSRHG